MASAITRSRGGSRGAAHTSVIPIPSAPFWTSIALTGVTATAAAFTLFAPGVLKGTAVMNGSARGTALVALFVAVPLLVCSVVLVSRGAVRPVISWLGAVAFLVYNAVLFLLATPFNSLFLLYISMFTLAFWTLVLLLRAIKVESFAGRYRLDLPVRALATYLGVVAILNAGAWLGGVIPGLFSKSPAFLEGTGLTTNPIYVQDLAFWIPTMVVTAVLLWRRQAWGIVLAGGMLVYFVIESISIAVDQWMGSAADPASTVASATFTPIFGAIALTGLVPLYFYLRSLNRRTETGPQTA
jgi:hypothetical protein